MTTITLELTPEQAQALHTFLWTAAIPWNAVGPSVNRFRIYQQLSPIANQLDRHVTHSAHV